MLISVLLELGMETGSGEMLSFHVGATPTTSGNGGRSMKDSFENEEIAETNKIPLTKELLEDLYARQKLGAIKIATKTGWSDVCIGYKIKKFGIPKRIWSE